MAAPNLPRPAKLSGNPRESQKIIADAFTAIGHANVVSLGSKKLVWESMNILQIFTKCMNLAASKVETKIFRWRRVEPSDANRYRDVTRRRRDCMKVLTALTNRAKIAGEVALDSASDTYVKAFNLFRLSNRKVNVSESQRSVIDATEMTNKRIKLVNEEMYLLLKAMEECLLVVDFETTLEEVSTTGSWMDIAKGLLTPRTVGGLTLSGCIYRQLNKIKDPIYYSFPGLGIPWKVLVPGSIITYFILNAIDSSLEDYKKYGRPARKMKLDHCRSDLIHFSNFCSLMDIPIPSFEKAKSKILGN